ncbi:hypothetical protein [Kitasatospora sp. NPDC058190]|uniref:hypothetical protein n=1 Tax=Kitasatospora sp. NPDC058190 TaxID=3346371 RepID=UPI0036D7B990
MLAPAGVDGSPESLAAARWADLLVPGRTGHRLVRGTRAVVHRACCPIAVVLRG